MSGGAAGSAGQGAKKDFYEGVADGVFADGSCRVGHVASSLQIFVAGAVLELFPVGCAVGSNGQDFGFGCTTSAPLSHNQALLHFEEPPRCQDMKQLEDDIFGETARVRRLARQFPFAQLVRGDARKALVLRFEKVASVTNEFELFRLRAFLNGLPANSPLRSDCLPAIGQLSLTSVNQAGHNAPCGAST